MSTYLTLADLNEYKIAIEYAFMLTDGEQAGIALAILAIILAVVVPILVERWKRPHLIIRLEPEQIPLGATRRFLHGRVINHPHVGILRGVERQPAYDTRVDIRFFRNDTLILGPVETKWTFAPECLSPIVQIMLPGTAGAAPTIQRIEAFDSTKTVLSHRRTVPPHLEGDQFDIVVKNEGHDSCFAFNGWSYQFPNVENPDLAIAVGTYVVEMQTTSGGIRSVPFRFVLNNNGPHLVDLETQSLQTV